jgi:heme-degrading monooxygenase HmoA
MLITVFRSRLKPGVREEYVALVDQMEKLARTMPGYVSHKGFFADDGERVTIVEFEHEEGLRAWRTNPEHIAAQKLARQKYYTEYSVQVCTLANRSSRPKRQLPQRLDRRPGSRHLAATKLRSLQHRPLRERTLQDRPWKSSPYSKASQHR